MMKQLAKPNELRSSKNKKSKPKIADSKDSSNKSPNKPTVPPKKYSSKKKLPANGTICVKKKKQNVTNATTKSSKDMKPLDLKANRNRKLPKEKDTMNYKRCMSSRVPTNTSSEH